MLYYYVHGFDTPFLLKKEPNIALGMYRRMRFHLVGNIGDYSTLSQLLFCPSTCLFVFFFSEYCS